MKSKDLRIGSIVSHESCQYKITGQDIFDLSIGKDINLFQPIKINENYLKAFGFKSRDGGDGFLIYEKDGVIIELPYFEFHHHECAIEIEFVHQLQNLYFALTGEELELKHESKP
jgi:hypothetical protein